MAIELVSIVEGTESLVGDGINAPVRALIRFENNAIQRAIVKTLPPASLAAELFCATLLRGWGLAVPDVAIVHGDPVRFASLDTGYPSLKQRIGWSETLPLAVKEALEHHGAKLVSEFTDTPRAIASDEAIDNRDRNLGNILWDGTEVNWIDHERAFGLHALPNRNLLAEMAINSGNTARIQQTAVAIALTLGQQAVDSALSECASFVDANTFADQIRTKLTHLATMVLNRFPQPNDLLRLGDKP